MALISPTIWAYKGYAYCLSETAGEVKGVSFYEAPVLKISI